MNSEIMENNLLLEQIYEVLDETGDMDERRDLLKRVIAVNPLDINSRAEWISYQKEEDQHSLYTLMLTEVRNAVLKEDINAFSDSESFMKNTRANLYLRSLYEYKTYLLDHGMVKEATKVMEEMSSLDKENRFNLIH